MTHAPKAPPHLVDYRDTDAWIDAHFEEQVRFLQALVQVPTDTPPGNNAAHAERTAELLQAFGFAAEKYPVPMADVQAQGMQSITNLIVRRPYAAGPTIALNAHGDVVPPGEGWTHDPYGGEVADGQLYGRAAAVSKSDFATYTFAVRALESLASPLAGTVELHFTYDEEFGGELGPGWLLRRGLTRPDWVIAAGFSYEVITAHNGCLQLEVTVQGRMAHAAVPHTGVDALQCAVQVLNALYAENTACQKITSSVPGITHPYVNVGRIEGGTHTNVVPGTVAFKLDRRMIPEEDPVAVEAHLRQLITNAARNFVPPFQAQGLGAGTASREAASVTVRRLLLAHAMQALPANAHLVATLQRHAGQLFDQPIPAMGSPLYTDARLYAQAGVPAVLYGAGPRTVLQSHSKRADERLDLGDLRRATKVIARTLRDLLA